MAVTISGMFGQGRTFFADSPVVIDIDGLYWGDPVTSPFTVVRVKVLYGNEVTGEFHADTGGQTSISFDISSALKAIWSDYGFAPEVGAAQSGGDSGVRQYRPYSLAVYTEYIDSNDGEFVTTSSGVFTGGQCAIGGFTEMERSMIDDPSEADVSCLEHRNLRNGDASTKPSGSPERVGLYSGTSWADVNADGTRTVFYPASAGGGKGMPDSQDAHAPLVLRDSIPYADFLFVNRRGAVETCSAQTAETMNISSETVQYSRTELPAFRPSRTLTSYSKGGRRSFQMSSGYQTREWAEWWAMEFLAARRWWMRYPSGDPAGRFLPVVVEPAKKQTEIYDRAKQQMHSVDFTVTLALQG